MKALASSRAVITGVGWAVAGPDFDPETALAGRGMRHKDRASKFALRVADRTLQDAGLLGAPELASAAVVLSSNFGNLETVCEFAAAIAAGSSTDVSPMRMPHLGSQIAAAWVALQHGICGPNLTLCNGASSGLDAVAWACKLLAARRATSALVIGVEPATPPVARLHGETGGTNWIDGAVGLMIEPAQLALDRGARIRAEITGYGKGDDERTALQAAGVLPTARRLAGEPGMRFGRCSGALGVVQCAMAVQELAGQELPGHAIVAVARAAAGENDETSVSALVLAPPGGIAA